MRADGEVGEFGIVLCGMLSIEVEGVERGREDCLMYFCFMDCLPPV